MGPVGEDKRWEAFGPFHDYLLNAFPLTSVFHSGIDIDRSNGKHMQPLVTRAYESQHVWLSLRVERLRPVLEAPSPVSPPRRRSRQP